MSAWLMVWFTVTLTQPVPLLNFSVPRSGSLVMVTPRLEMALSTSDTLKSPQPSTRSVSSMPVTAPPEVTGASLTATTLTVVVAVLEVFTPSVTVTVMTRGVVLGSSLVLRKVMFLIAWT
ncbi:hypothetical protein PS627_04566 [Pseudomonas fluorescens]|nr:hypothetical protein PS627_04532 [Pseudomonas fluorescens]CAG8871636.1 hypothetical protein PS627_04566 [Pseudomonas fluorescens]